MLIIDISFTKRGTRMKNKSILLIIIAIFVFLIGVFIYSFSYIKSKDDVRITDDYIAIFKGTNGNKTYSTYMYKMAKGTSIYYKYINTVVTANNFDSTNSYERILKTGTVKTTDKVFDIAQSNNAYDYVIVKGYDETLSIAEFKDYLK